MKSLLSSLFDVVAVMTTGSWNMILVFLNKDIISDAKQLLWTGRVSDVQRRNENISCAIQQLRFFELFYAKTHDISPGEKMPCLPVT